MSFGELEFEKEKKIGLDIDHYGDEFDIYFRGNIEGLDTFHVPINIFKQIYGYIFYRAKYKSEPYSLINLMLQLQNEKRIFLENNLFKTFEEENNFASINLIQKNTFFKEDKYIEIKLNQIQYSFH